MSTRSPLPPGGPKQSAPGSVLTLAGEVRCSMSASIFPLLASTRSSAVTAPAVAGTVNEAARAHAAASHRRADECIWPPFPRGTTWLAGDRSPGFRAKALAPSRDRVATPVADYALRSRAMPHCPVTVAGPRRFHTGLPLTTDRISGEVLSGYSSEGLVVPKEARKGAVGALKGLGASYSPLRSSTLRRSSSTASGID